MINDYTNKSIKLVKPNEDKKVTLFYKEKSSPKTNVGNFFVEIIDLVSFNWWPFFYSGIVKSSKSEDKYMDFRKACREVDYFIFQGWIPEDDDGYYQIINQFGYNDYLIEYTPEEQTAHI